MCWFYIKNPCLILQGVQLWFSVRHTAEHLMQFALTVLVLCLCNRWMSAGQQLVLHLPGSADHE